MRTRVKPRRCVYRFEPLEKRTMLAGDVRVIVAGDDLIVIGDENHNGVFIEGTGVAGGYVIEGTIDSTGTLDTNVFLNGVLQGGAFIVTGATGNIIIDLNGGDDAILINNVNVDELIINTDDGHDVVVLGPGEEAAEIINGGGGGGGGGSGGEGGPLPTGPEVDNGNLIDNDVAANTIGHLELLVDAAGDSEQGGFTAQGENLLFVNANFIFQYFGYIDIDGDVSQLSDTTITQQPTLVDPDEVQSRGEFEGDNGLVQWRAVTSIDDGDTRITTTITFTSVTPIGESPSDQIEQQVRTFGDLNFISFLDADIGVDAEDDIMFSSGTPGSPDFKVFTLDSDERVGLAHGGVYAEGPGLTNAQWLGWTSDVSDDVQESIENDGGTFSTAGTIDVGTGPQQLPQGSDPEFGTIFGPRDIETAFAWQIDPQATTATVTFFIELEPGEPAPDVQDLEGSVGVNDLLVINTHGGNDVVAALRVFGGATWAINLGDEDDHDTTNLTDENTLNNLIPGVPLNDQAFVFIASGGNIGINGGTGDDLVNINYLTAHGVLVVDGVTGNDVISVNGSVFNEDVVLLGGSGMDTVAVDFSRHDDGRDAVIVIDSGADADFILFARLLVREGVVRIVSGGGNDRVIVGLYYADIFGNLATGGNEVRVISIDTDGGNDTVDIRANLVEELFGIFGSGDDTVTVAFNHVTSDDTVGLGGGSGFDKLISGGNIFGDHVHIHDFESLIDFLFGDGDTESPGTDV